VEGGNSVKRAYDRFLNPA